MSGLQVRSLYFQGPHEHFTYIVISCLVPQFSEHDPNTFFSLFERSGWTDADHTLLLQCVMTGKAQEAYSALSVAQSKEYSVEVTVMKAQKLVPMVYHKRFWSWQKSTQQTEVLFARELVTFCSWCTLLEICSYGDLCNLVVLEQFKDSVRVILLPI